MQLSDKEQALLSHAIRKMQREKDPPLLTEYLVANLLENSSRPTPAEQINNLLFYLGNSIDEPGQSIILSANFIRATIGALSVSGAMWVIDQLESQCLVVSTKEIGAGFESFLGRGITLTLAGWDAYLNLQSQVKNTKKAFMAMKFGDSELNRVYAECFKPAVRQAGFDLIMLAEDTKAGLIDDRMRVEIRNARFLIADLSHGNAGAYWEAGFAEGLGRPVIYTCKQEIFDDPAHSPHFDTNHYLTVPWVVTNLNDAAKRLTVTIRATLPDESKLVDD